MASATESSQWPLLPGDILRQITNRLLKYSDYVRFGAVCKGWHSFAHESYKLKDLLHLHQNLPLLLIPTEDQEKRGLYNITQGMVYDQFQLNLPNKRCCGSCYGWLFFVDKVNKHTLELILINPFLRDSETIKLPPIKFGDEDEWEEILMDQYGVKKAILSKDPYVSPHDYEVVALYGSFAKLAHYKSGDKYWSYAKKGEREVLADVIFYKDLILAVDHYNCIINFTLEPKRRIQRTDWSPCYMKRTTIGKKLDVTASNYAGNAYLVENSNGDLLLARRYYWDKDFMKATEALGQMYDTIRLEIAKGGTAIALLEQYHKIENNMFVREKAPSITVKFKVYRLTFSSTGKLRPNIRTKTLDGDILFLGDNYSISVSASKYPQLYPNSIYYTDDYPGDHNIQFGSCDNGIFNVEKENFDKYYLPSFSTKGMPPPIFVVPRIS